VCKPTRLGKEVTVMMKMTITLRLGKWRVTISISR